MTDPLVDRIVRRIAKAVHPDKIILFGSRALLKFGAICGLSEKSRQDAGATAGGFA